MNKHDGCKDWSGWLAAFTVAAIVGVIILAHALTKNKRETEQLAKELARTQMDDLPDSAVLSSNDAWGNPMKFQRVATELQVTQIITSAGEDGKFGTSDDIQKEDTDLNKSRIFGKWVSSRTKEFVKGLKDGENTPSRFDNFAVTQPTTKPSVWDRLRHSNR